MALTWYINRKNIATEYGCYVEGSSGLMDMPRAKNPLSADIDDYHGTMIYGSDVRYQGRDILLSCFCIGTSIDDFNEKINDLKVELSQDGPHQLTITGMTTPVSYIVLCTDGFAVSKQWRASGLTIGTFNLKLYEPCPVKRVVLYTGGSTTLQIPFLDASGRIYWGDGESTGALDTNEIGNYVHNYSSGTYYIVITGAIDPEGATYYGGGTLLWEQLL